MAKAGQERVANWSYVNANGQVLTAEDADEDSVMEIATGVYYKDLGSGRDTVYQIPGAVAGSVQTMLALFGAKTKFGNTASTARQKRKKGEDSATDMDAVLGFIDELADGNWPRKEGARGPRYDDETIILAVAEVAASQGQTPDENRIRERVESEEGYKTKAMRNPQVAAAYLKLKDQVVAEINDLI